MAAPYLKYRRDLTGRARGLRRDPTSPERKLWYIFLSRLPQKFTRQKPLGSYIADFYCSSGKLVIELDGDSHFTTGAEQRDAQRTEAMRLHGIRVVRFTNTAIRENFEAVCAAILRELES